VKYKINEELTLEFTPGVLADLNKYRQFGKRKEAGGILLGQVFDDRVLIDEITLPSIWDRAGKLFFIRNVRKAQKEVNKTWVKSGGKRIYLGEWHTHPEVNPTPSSDDKKLILNMLKDTKMEIDFLFLVIVGLDDLDLYVGYQKVDQLRKLSRIL